MDTLNTDYELLKFKFKLSVLFNLPKNMVNCRLEISIRHHGVLNVVYTQVKYNVQVRTVRAGKLRISSLKTRKLKHFLAK